MQWNIHKFLKVWHYFVGHYVFGDKQLKYFFILYWVLDTDVLGSAEIQGTVRAGVAT